MSQDGARRSRRQAGKMARDMEEEEAECVVRAKVKQLAGFIRDSKYAVVYTGAGISTAAGVPDFRGPSGVWTLQAKGESVAEPDFTKLNPTLSHNVLKSLIEMGHVHHIVTQNIDSLHLRSGISLPNQSELHGNYSLEICPICDARYFRSHAVWTGLTTPTSANTTSASRDSNRVISKGDARNKGCGGKVAVTKMQIRKIDHKTGRLCEADSCCGELQDSVVLFGEDLLAKEVESAWDHTDRADLALVLGSSLRVGPACDMPVQVTKNGGKLVIVNLQKTPLDGRATLVIHSRCDEVMRLLSLELELELKSQSSPQQREKDTKLGLYLYLNSNNEGEILHEGSQLDDHEIKWQQLDGSFMIEVSDSPLSFQDVRADSLC